MRARWTVTTLAASAVLVAAGAVPAAAAPALPLYRYVDLGALGKPNRYAPISEAAGLNEAATVVGNSTTAGAYRLHAFSWNSGSFRDLGTLSRTTAAFSAAAAVNESGVVVGHTNIADDREPPHAFRVAGGAMTDLGTGYGSGSGSAARDVNDSGVVVGTHFVRQGEPERAVVWRDGRIIDLGTLGGRAGAWGTDSIAYAVNGGGTVVGGALTTSGDLHAFRWTGNGLTDLGTLGGSGSTWATAVNDGGDVAGVSVNRSGQSHAARWTGGTVQDLGTLGGTGSAAAAINTAGLVVGGSRTAGDSIYGSRAFLWSGDRMVDLNTRVPDLPEGVTLVHAADVNDRGAIAGFACPYDCAAGGFQDRHAFLLVPLS